MNAPLLFVSVARLSSPNYYWPNVVVNPLILNDLKRWLGKGNRPERVLVDTGVHTLFHKYGLEKYPEWFDARYAWFIRVVHRLAGDVEEFAWVIPDVPADYETTAHLYPKNVQVTLENIKRYLKLYVGKLPGEPLAVVQGKKDDADSVVNTYLSNLDVYGEFERIAVGPTCATKQYRDLARMILRFDKVAKHDFHVFGMHLKAFSLVAGRTQRFYSFDSSAMFYLPEGGKKVETIEERRRALDYWLQRYKEITFQKSKQTRLF